MIKKALLLTYYWPPSGGSGVQRWTYFSKYLKRFGVDPVVVTVDPGFATYPSIDESLLNDVKDIRVIHTKSFEPLQLYSKLIAGNKKDGVPFGDVQISGKKSPLKKMAAFVRGNLVLPDARKYWKRYALSAAKELLDKERFDVIISTGPPHSTHLIAQTLKKHYNLPWIADFRDPWTEVFYNEDLYRTNWAKKIDLKLEMSVLQSADAILCVSDYTATLVKNKLDSPKKVFTLINGFDHELFEKVSIKKNEAFTVSYIGYLGKHHPYDLFIKGMQKALELLPAETNVQFDITGKVDAEIVEEFNQIPEVEVNYHGVVSHVEAIKKMKSADLLLLSIPKSSYSKGIITGKLLEYIATGNPIILVGEKKGDAAKILNNFENTLAVDEIEVFEFANFVNKYRNKTEVEDRTQTAKAYTREAATNLLVDIMNKVVESSSRL